MLVALEAERFRNLEPLGWRPDAGRHLVLGGNGAGKTSLLEAVYAVATTRSFRTPRLGECVAHGEGSFEIRAEVEEAARTSLFLGWGGDGRSRSVNGSETSLAEHLAVLPVVAWTAADLETISGGPALRRRFLDRSVVGRRASALEALTRYRRAMGQKRQALATLTHQDGGRADLAAWNGVVAPAAAELIALRAEAARELRASLERVLEALDLPIPPIILRYRPSPAVGLEGPEAVLERLERLEQAERRRGVPLAGPHRDELEIAWGDHSLAQVASAGERKIASLALVLAQGLSLEAHGREPLYLLDDVDAELAQDRLAALWRAVEGARQLVASSNRPGVWEGLRIEHRWRMAGGVVEPA